ncbi:MAG: ectonucleotide pyrophosphatase/phosphodiesterase [Rhizomicrobium sp.]
MRLAALAFAALLAAAAPAAAAPVLMISIDGLRPADVIDAPARGLKVPNLRAIMADGAWASGVRNTLPTVTYPDHTTLITGVWPAVHGVTSNTVFDPLGKNMDGWYWYARDIKVATLWDMVHKAGGKVASVSWPVSVGTPFIDYDIPEYWRAFVPVEDAKLVNALSTPGLADELSRVAHTDQTALVGTEVDNDQARTAFAIALLQLKRPQFTTVHLASLDHNQHKFGPGTPQAHAVLEQTDAMIGEIVAAARQAEPGIVIAIVSDHGFAPVEHDVNLISAFAKAGLVTRDAKTGKITAWQAEPWNAGGSTAIMLADPADAAVKAKVAALLKTLAADPANGIGEVIDRDGIARRGGGVEPSFWVDYRIGYEGGRELDGPLVGPPTNKGTHGYFPSHPEMRATFMIDGIAKKGTLGEIDMIDIAPTLAKVLGVELPQATGKPLF